MSKQAYTPTPLDQLVNTEDNQLLKALLPYFPSSYRRFFSLYTKINEVLKTLSLFPEDLKSMQICEVPPNDPAEIISQIRPYIGESTRKKLDQMSQILILLQSMDIVTDNSFSKGDSYEQEQLPS